MWTYGKERIDNIVEEHNDGSVSFLTQDDEWLPVTGDPINDVISSIAVNNNRRRVAVNITYEMLAQYLGFDDDVDIRTVYNAPESNMITVFATSPRAQHVPQGAVSPVIDINDPILNGWRSNGPIIYGSGGPLGNLLGSFTTSGMVMMGS